MKWKGDPPPDSDLWSTVALAMPANSSVWPELPGTLRRLGIPWHGTRLVASIQWVNQSKWAVLMAENNGCLSCLTNWHENKRGTFPRGNRLGAAEEAFTTLTGIIKQSGLKLSNSAWDPCLWCWWCWRHAVLALSLDQTWWQTAMRSELIMLNKIFLYIAADPDTDWFTFI